MLSVRLRFTDSDYPFGIFKLFLYLCISMDAYLSYHQGDSLYVLAIGFHGNNLQLLASKNGMLSCVIPSSIERVIFNYDMGPICVVNDFWILITPLVSSNSC
jgi:hypothetical protein